MIKTLMAAGLALLAQDDSGKRLVESRVKKAVAPRVEPAKVDLAASGIEWRRGLPAALHAGRPVLLFQLLGDFDDVHC